MAPLPRSNRRFGETTRDRSPAVNTVTALMKSGWTLTFSGTRRRGGLTGLDGTRINTSAPPPPPPREGSSPGPSALPAPPSAKGPLAPKQSPSCSDPGPFDIEGQLAAASTLLMASCTAR